ncbi:hypothetical protein [Pseudomonas corrugata]
MTLLWTDQRKGARKNSYHHPVLCDGMAESMLYEKRKIKKFVESRAFHNIILGVGLAIIAGEMLYLFAPSTFWGPIKFIDLVNVLAQLATAGVFLLGIHQFLQGKNIERQAVLVKESRDLIMSMEKASEAFFTSDRTYSSITTFMTDMNTHAANFNIVFRELSEDIHKAIVRMHWQNMYFGTFTKAVENLYLPHLLEGIEMPYENYLKALSEYSARTIKREPEFKPFQEYRKAKFLIEEIVKMEHKPFKDTDRYLFFGFQVNLFENEELEDLTHGTLNIIDVRVRAPGVAAINDMFNGNLLKSFRGAKKANKQKSGTPLLISSTAEHFQDKP